MPLGRVYEFLVFWATSTFTDFLATSCTFTQVEFLATLSNTVARVSNLWSSMENMRYSTAGHIQYYDKCIDYFTQQITFSECDLESLPTQSTRYRMKLFQMFLSNDYSCCSFDIVYW